MSITKLETEGPVWWTQNTWIVHTNRTVTPVTRCSPLLVFLVYVSIFFYFKNKWIVHTNRTATQVTRFSPCLCITYFVGNYYFLVIPYFYLNNYAIWVIFNGVRMWWTFKRTSKPKGGSLPSNKSFDSHSFQKNLKFMSKLLKTHSQD